MASSTIINGSPMRAAKVAFDDVAKEPLLLRTIADTRCWRPILSHAGALAPDASMANLRLESADPARPRPEVYGASPIKYAGLSA